ncbi:hypothetical protein E2C01_012149 [Portunus trituberculatus]|uniref:Uncharacterized protein n=1 Tax=Portunus trituberculatus TaxID=210409 RepID=A0A5B7DD65_PORTR|nr:hypothetical protein [Portunus trituberculatus]
MAPKRFIDGENKESCKSASVSESHPFTSGFTGITPDIFMDGDLSSDDLPPPPLFFYIIHHQPSFTYSAVAAVEGALASCGAVAEAASHDLLLTDSRGGADAWTGMLVMIKNGPMTAKLNRRQ